MIIKEYLSTFFIKNLCCRYSFEYPQIFKFLVYLLKSPIIIHVIFSWAQIGRSAIFGREIGVPDREIFSRQKKIKFNVKNCLFASA